jgi:hypothetical protein
LPRRDNYRPFRLTLEIAGSAGSAGSPPPEDGEEPKVVSYESGEPYDVYVGRGKRGTGLKKSKWHNPFKVGTKDEKRDGTPVEVVEKHTRYILEGPVENYEGKVFDGRHLLDELPELIGKTLCCHCAPEPCHADLLLVLAENAAKFAPYMEAGMTYKQAEEAYFRETTGGEEAF